MDKRIMEIGKLWVKWNCREVTGDEFAYRFGTIFSDFTMQAWNQYLKEKKKPSQNEEDPLEKLLV